DPEKGGAGKDEKTKGKIIGRVLQGDRPQAKVTVSLKDAKDPKAAVKATAITDAKGQYVFENVDPGPYTVSAEKAALNIKGSTKVTVPEKAADPKKGNVVSGV